jgi:hypothetical protein
MDRSGAGGGVHPGRRAGLWLPPRPGDGPAAGRAHPLPAAAPGASGRAGPLPGNRRGTRAGAASGADRGARRRQRASPSSFPSPRSRCRAPRCSPRACATSPAANKPGPNSRAPGKRLRQSERLQSLGSRPGAWRTTSTTCPGSPCTAPPSSCSAPPATRPPAPTPNRSGPPPSRARCNPRCSPGFPRCRPPAGSVTRASPAARAIGGAAGAIIAAIGLVLRGQAPATAHTAGPPPAAGLIAPGTPRTRGLPGKRGNWKRLGAVDATGGVHRSLRGVFFSVRCLAPTPGGRARTGPPAGRDAGRPRGRSWCAGRRRAG